jgi:hypothetical protein
VTVVDWRDSRSWEDHPCHRTDYAPSFGSHCDQIGHRELQVPGHQATRHEKAVRVAHAEEHVISTVRVDLLARLDLDDQQVIAIT